MFFWRGGFLWGGVFGLQSTHTKSPAKERIRTQIWLRHLLWKVLPRAKPAGEILQCKCGCPTLALPAQVSLMHQTQRTGMACSVDFHHDRFFFLLKKKSSFNLSVSNMDY